MINQLTLVGRVGKDPEIKTFQNGGKVANFSIATTEKWKDKQTGEMKEATEWHNVAVFGPLAQVVEAYVTKGKQIFVQGQSKTRSWDSDSGKKYITECVLQGPQAKLVLLGDRQGQAGATGGSSGHQQQQQKPSQQQEDLDDDIPF